MRQVFLFLLLIVPVLAWADTNTSADIDVDTGAQLRELEKRLALIQQESQSTYQQFVMIQELRRNETLAASISPVPSTSPSITGSNPVPQYEDMIQRKQEKEARIEQYTADSDRLYARYKELEDERQLLIEQIHQLDQETEE